MRELSSSFFLVACRASLFFLLPAVRWFGKLRACLLHYFIYLCASLLTTMLHRFIYQLGPGFRPSSLTI